MEKSREGSQPVPEDKGPEAEVLDQVFEVSKVENLLGTLREAARVARANEQTQMVKFLGVEIPITLDRAEEILNEDGE